MFSVYTHVRMHMHMCMYALHKHTCVRVCACTDTHGQIVCRAVIKKFSILNNNSVFDSGSLKLSAGFKGWFYLCISFLLWSGLLQVSTVAVIAMVMLYLAATFHEALSPVFQLFHSLCPLIWMFPGCWDRDMTYMPCLGLSVHHSFILSAPARYESLKYISNAVVPMSH